MLWLYRGGGTGPADPAAAGPIIYSEITTKDDLTTRLKNFNIFFKFNIILLLIVYNYHFAICYLLLSAQPSSFFTRLYTSDLRTVSLIFTILINAILYYVICLLASVPTQASLPVKFHPPKSFRLPKRKFERKTEVISSGMV